MSVGCCPSCCMQSLLQSQSGQVHEDCHHRATFTIWKGCWLLLSSRISKERQSSHSWLPVDWGCTKCQAVNLWRDLQICWYMHILQQWCQGGRAEVPEAPTSQALPFMSPCHSRQENMSIWSTMAPHEAHTNLGSTWEPFRGWNWCASRQSEDSHREDAAGACRCHHICGLAPVHWHGWSYIHSSCAIWPKTSQTLHQAPPAGYPCELIHERSSWRMAGQSWHTVRVGAISVCLIHLWLHGQGQERDEWIDGPCKWGSQSW